MFKPARLTALLIVSVLVTMFLSRMDSDTGADTIVQTLTFGAVIFVVVAILYAAVCGLLANKKP